MILGIIASATHIRSDGAFPLFTDLLGPCRSQNLKKKMFLYLIIFLLFVHKITKQIFHFTHQ